MTGLIPRADYDRLARRCEKLEEENAWLKGEVTDITGEERRRALRSLLPPKVVHGELILLERLIDTRIVRYDDHYSARSQASIAASLRKALRAAGCAVDAIRCARHEGHYLTDAGRAWLKQNFPQPGGPTR